MDIACIFETIYAIPKAVNTFECETAKHIIHHIHVVTKAPRNLAMYFHSRNIS